MIEANKKTALAFFDLCFNQHQPKKAADDYLKEPYIQHNPQVDSGVDAFVRFFEGFFKRYPESFVQVKQVIAENDLVVLHVLFKRDMEDAGDEVVEFFRLDGGKIVEHWDVIAPLSKGQ